MTLSLPPLNSNTPIVDPATGNPTTQFQRFWETSTDQIVSLLNQIIAIPEIQTALGDLDLAIITAQGAANAANTAANLASSANALLGSYPNGLTLTATDAGSSATIAISAHTRVYSTGPSVSVAAGSIAGLAYSTLYYLYYDDPTHIGGTVTYFATTSAATAAQTGNRHTVGKVTTPAALAGPSAGSNVRPPGVGLIP